VGIHQNPWGSLNVHLEGGEDRDTLKKKGKEGGSGHIKFRKVGGLTKSFQMACESATREEGGKTSSALGYKTLITGREIHNTTKRQGREQDKQQGIAHKLPKGAHNNPKTRWEGWFAVYILMRALKGGLAAKGYLLFRNGVKNLNNISGWGRNTE